MDNWIILTIGFSAQLLFSGRSLTQWVLSEKQKQSMTPLTFWWFSLGGAFLLFVYGYLRADFAIMLGQSLTYFIYIRNLQLQQQWDKIPKLLGIFLWVFPVLIVFYAYNNGQYDLEKLFKNEDIPVWLLILGSVAQVVFTFRFIYQWIYAEKRKESSLPFGFWLLSLTGAILILTYAILRKDIVLFLGHTMGIIIYTRNLMLIRKQG